MTARAQVITEQALAGMLVPRAALELAVDMLARVAADCQACGGNGWTGEPYVLFLMTDDPRNGPRRGLITRRARVFEHGPEVDPLIRGAGMLKSACLECAAIRQVIETAGRSL